MGQRQTPTRAKSDTAFFTLRSTTKRIKNIKATLIQSNFYFAASPTEFSHLQPRKQGWNSPISSAFVQQCCSLLLTNSACSSGRKQTGCGKSGANGSSKIVSQPRKIRASKTHIRISLGFLLPEILLYINFLIQCLLNTSCKQGTNRLLTTFSTFVYKLNPIKKKQIVIYCKSPYFNSLSLHVEKGIAKILKMLQWNFRKVLKYFSFPLHPLKFCKMWFNKSPPALNSETARGRQCPERTKFWYSPKGSFQTQESLQENKSTLITNSPSQPPHGRAQHALSGIYWHNYYTINTSLAPYSIKLVSYIT